MHSGHVVVKGDEVVGRSGHVELVRARRDRGATMGYSTKRDLRPMSYTRVTAVCFMAVHFS